MLILFYLFGLILGRTKSASIIIKVVGNYPGIVFSEHFKSNRTSSSKRPDIVIIEASKFTKPPPKMYLKCNIQDQISNYIILQKKGGHKGNDVNLDKSMLGSLEIFQLLNEHNFTVGLIDPNQGCKDITHSSYIIQSNEVPIPENYEEIPVSSSRFIFLQTLHNSFFVYSRNNNLIAEQICQIDHQISLTYFLFEIIVLYILIVAIRIIQLIKPRFEPPRNLQFWTFDQNMNVINGAPLDSLDSTSLKYLNQTVEQTKLSKIPSSSVIRLRREEFSHKFERASAYVLPNGYAIAFLYEETLPPAPSRLQFDCKFTSNIRKVIREPELTFTSFRDMHPIHLKFMLDNNVKFQADLPGSILAPFQPYGRLITVVLSIFDDLVKFLTNSPFILTNYQEFSRRSCKKINARLAYVFINKQRIIFKYQDEKLEPLPDEQVKELYNKVELQRGIMLVNDLITKGKRCFLYRVKSVDSDFFVVIELETEFGNDFYERFCLHFFSLCCIFMYQLSHTKEQNLKFERFVALLTDVDPSFTIIEASFPSRTLLTFFSQRIKNIQEMKDMDDYFSRRGLHELKDAIEQIRTNALNGHSLYRTTTKFDNIYEDKPTPTYLSMSAVKSEDPETEENVVTMLFGNVTEIKEKEADQLEILHSLQQIAQNLDIVRFTVDENLNDAILSNSTVLKQLKYTEFDSLSLKSLISPKDLDLFEKVLHEGGKQAIRLISSDGTDIWYYMAVTDSASSNQSNPNEKKIRNSPFSLEDVELNTNMNEKEGFMFMVNDITDIRHRLQTNDETLVPSSSNLVFWYVDPETELVHSFFMQPTIWDSLSVDRDMKFSRFSDFIHKNDRQKFIDNYTAIENKETNHWSDELRLIRVGGAYEWHKVSISRVANGYLHCLALNIHSQKEIEAKHRETQQLRDLLLSIAKLALWKFNDNNDPIEPMHRFDPGLQNIVTMNWTFVNTYVHPDYRALLREKIKRAFAHDEYIEIDLPLLLDEEIWVSVRGKSRGQTMRQIFGLCIDITDLRNAYSELEKEKKRAEEANRQKTVFLSNMSHEIRTPMNGIFGLLDVLAVKELTSEQRTLDDSIRASSFQLLKLINDTLNLTKIEQGTICCKPQIFNLSKLFEPICIATSSRARLNNLKLNVFIDKQFPLLIYGDSQLFSQILNNLLSNALKFTKKGSISINLSWAETNGTEFCILEVADTGIGITSDQQRIIFERFAQANASVQRFFGGTGLGLSLVQDIVHFLGGSVKVESELNQGTKFIVEIPFESILIPYSAPFNDGKVHSVLINVLDQQLKDSLLDWIPYHNYRVYVFEKAEEIEQISKESIIEAIFVEGNPPKWPKFAEATNSLPGKRPPIVSMCEAGEPSYFKYTIAKPVQYFHLIELLHAFRYKLMNLSSTFSPISNEDQSKHILVVEDNKSNQFVMGKILDTLGCTYKIANNGKEALTILDNEEFDLVFMDCQMPVLDGIEATRIIRRSSKTYASIPIIALTAQAIEGDEQTCREAGMDGYLAKPVRIQQISNIMKKFN